MLLAEGGADVNKETNGGMSALQSAIMGGHLSCVKILVAYGANRTLRLGPRGSLSRTLTAEQLAAQVSQAAPPPFGMPQPFGLTGNAEVAAWLRATRHCSTPLHYVDIVTPAHATSLLRAGADLYAKDFGFNVWASPPPTPFSLAEAAMPRR